MEQLKAERDRLAGSVKDIIHGAEHYKVFTSSLHSESQLRPTRVKVNSALLNHVFVESAGGL